MIAFVAYFYGVNAQVTSYFNTFRQKGSFDYKLEQKILSSTSPKKLFKQLNTYYTDTLVQVRQQAYYLSYKAVQQAELGEQQRAVCVLLKGCADINNAVIGRCLLYLKSFPVTAFTADSKESLQALMQKKKIAHFRELYMLVGYVGVGFGIIQQQLLGVNNYNNNQRWVMRLVLARMGHAKSIEYCMQMAKQVEDGNNKAAYLVPDLIYTRQREAIDYCVDILNNDKKNCFSPNPDLDAKILCGYRVLELLAPVIRQFPYKAGPAGSLLVDDYEEALYKAREWFVTNPEYKINTDKF